MATSTLTSLAILKVNIDQGKDYIDYLRPFVLHTLVERDPGPVTSDVVQKYIREDFGLEIPERTVEIVLRRLVRRHPIKKEKRVYERTGALPDPQIAARRAEAERHIDSVLYGLLEFSQETPHPISDVGQAERAISAFLAKFDVSCLRTYLRGTAIPDVSGTKEADMVLVSEYVQHLNGTNPERFQSFIVLVQGHMLANALLCPDLENISNSYRGVTFYLDTPLLVRNLGCEGDAKQNAVREVVIQVKRLGGQTAAFSHSRDELRGVLQGAANHLESPDARGAVVVEARKHGITRSDLLLLAERVDDELETVGISVEDTPRYIEQYQIDEAVFGDALNDEVSYLNPRAKQYDINSVRSIYVLRGNFPAPSLEKSRAVLVTSNSGFANAAWEYGQEYSSSQNVSSVISDFTLANTAWLKAPMGAPTIPRTQLLALSYAALEPSSKLLEAYLREIDRLEARGRITEDDLQLLRSSPLVYPELMHLTLGEDTSVTPATVSETLRRVYKVIEGNASERLRTESEKLEISQASIQETSEALRSQLTQNQEIVSNLFWRCRRKAKRLGWIVSVISVAVVLILALGVGYSLELVPQKWIPRWLSIVGTVLLGLVTLGGLVIGYTVKDIHSRVQGHILNWLISREEKAIGIDFSGYERN